MKTLILYYSRDGHTKKLCTEIAKNLKSDIGEIVDLKDRKRKIIGWIISGKDALNKNLTDISCSKDCSKYSLIILGTPNWVGTMTPAVRTYLIKNKDKLNGKKVAFICTFGGNEGKVFKDMQELSDKPVAILGLKDKDIDNKTKDVTRKINEFCDILKNK